MNMINGEVDKRQAQAKEIAGLAEHLIELATTWGFVVTIKQAPKEPLAMGNYLSEVEVRDDGATYKRMMIEAKAQAEAGGGV